eukprot:CAMPEP_0118643272 /NCGR_PEP_ID=MMETSP0785-20121206/6303_1 /TAXON_ID=91992 /ORGANISM="Bolidomonas pacifica, Strain CCMP 1866" /LENGTH=296 /DNA_ID=CAMNT_0006534925 /DNA_START=545 /DNA_END=1431 /DNA_ORIENTATION=+
MAPIIILGSCNVDQITYCPKFPSNGETLYATSFSTFFGGKGANQAYQSSLLSPSPNYVAFIGMVGDDEHERRIRENFNDVGVDTEHLLVGKEQTGIATIQVDGNGENRILIVPGANFELKPEDVQGMKGKIKSASIMVGQLEISPETTSMGFEIAKEHGVTTVLNPAPASPLSTLPPTLLKNTDYLVPNQPELSLLSNLPTTTPSQCVIASRYLIEKHGVKNVIVTMGGSGAMLVTPTVEHHVPCPPLPLPLVDTVGAGDSFLGGMSYYISKGVEVADAMVLSNGVAGWSVGGKGG